MIIKLLRPPPTLTVAPTWRELYEARSFSQRELIDDGRLRSAAKERELSIGIGREAVEDLDLAGALRPIAFSEDGYWTGFSSPAMPSDVLKFKDEGEPLSWSEHEWESEMEPGLPNVTALYSPWQLLYIDDVLDGTGADISLETLLLDGQDREAQFDRLRCWAAQQDSAWRQIDEAWSPVLRVLVAIQNLYWPEVTGRVQLLPGLPEGDYVVAGPDRAGLRAGDLLEFLACSTDEVVSAYQFLVERGLDRDPRDGLTLLRRARPRAFQMRWRGLPRRAQDNFDAAETLRLFLVDLLRKQPPRTPNWPLDGRQPERVALYERGPAAPWSPVEVKAELLAAELYPHGVHVVGEGPSEELVVMRLVQHLIGSGALSEVSFFNLGGSGSAKYVEPLADAFGDYAIRALVIVDREGQMAEYVAGAEKRGAINSADVLLFDDSLEASNASAEELIELARRVGSSQLEAGESEVAFELTGAELELIHADRVSRSPKNGKPGLADTLIREVADRTDGALVIPKLDLVEVFVEFLVLKFDEGSGEEREALKMERPIIGFVIDRLIDALNRPRPIGVNP